MRPTDIRNLLRHRPFEPIEIGLSDGRSVLVRHPYQVVVAERHLIVGLAEVKRSRPLATPKSGDAIARDWLLVNFLHIVSAEPANGHRPSRRQRRG